jgi:uncharacterized protein
MAKLLISLGVILIIGSAIVYSLTGDKKDQTNVEPKNQTQKVDPTNAPLRAAISTSATPFPFQEMTIPYLRQYQFKSSLKELRKVSENQNYISYLTSYTSDDLKIQAQLTQPKGEKPTGGWPAIVFIHGYIPPSQYRTLERYTSYVDYLAKNKFVVFKIDLRGHGDSEGEAGGGYYSSDYVIDTLNAYSALQASDFVDPQKIGLWGHSMAGNVSLRSFVSHPDTPALVVWGGAGFTYTDLREYRISDNSYRPQPSDSPSQQRRRELFAMYGDFKPENSFWKQVVPTNYISDVKGGIQLHHAVDDTVVSINYSRNLNKILDSTSIEHQLFEYPSGGHNITGSSFNSAMQRTVEFYKKHLTNN